MNMRWIRHNKIIVSIIIFILLFVPINLVRPAFLYNTDGSIKDFGLGYKRKTIIPIWFISISLAIITYFGVMYYTTVYR